VIGRIGNKWAAALLAAGFGAAAGFAFPPFGVLPGILGWAGLLWLLDGTDPERRLRSAFWRAWVFCTSFFVVGTWWVVEAFLVDAESHGWMAPIIVCILPMGMGLFWGSAAVLYRKLAVDGPARVLVFAASFGFIEWLRNWLLTGFPWNMAGQTWKAGGAISQSAAVFGGLGLTVITLAIVAAPAVLAGSGSRRARFGAVTAAVAALAGLYGYGALRLSQAEVSDTDLRIRIVQADVSQEEKWSPGSLPAVVDAYVRQSQAPGLEAADVVVWPEGALPAAFETLFDPASPFGPQIASAVRPGQHLFMGASRAGPDGSYYLNSFAFLHREPAGLRIMGFYDKHHLLPFGEYLPLGSLMTRLGVRSLVNMPADYAPGLTTGPVSIPGLPLFQPIICYESIFADSIAGKGPRPLWIVLPSNDSWYGQTSGPWQHLQLGAYRSIEHGIPMVRSTPTGVSAMIDPYGRIRPGQSLSLGQAGVIDAALPAATRPTLFSRWRNLPFWIMVLIGAGVAAAPRLRRGPARDKRVTTAPEVA
jgi:apolipoprotein N-acyltransferase